MALQDKYAALIQYVQGNGISNTTIQEQEGVLYVTCTAPDSATKDKIWKMYETLDPDMRSGDLVLNVTIDPAGEQTYEVRSGDNLSKIAAKIGGVSWKEIFEANRDQISDPDKIFPGQILKIPK